MPCWRSHGSLEPATFRLLTQTTFALYHCIRLIGNYLHFKDGTQTRHRNPTWVLGGMHPPPSLWRLRPFVTIYHLIQRHCFIEISVSMRFRPIRGKDDDERGDEVWRNWGESTSGSFLTSNDVVMLFVLVHSIVSAYFHLFKYCYLLCVICLYVPIP